MIRNESLQHVEFFIGDVHGCFDPLVALEAKCLDTALARGFSHQDIRFVYLGDLIDRGPQVRQVLEHLRRGRDTGSHFCIAGNHEAIFLSFIEFFCKSSLRELVGHARSFIPILDELRLSSQNQLLDPKNYALELFRSWFAQGGGTTLKSFGLTEDPQSWEISDPDLRANIEYLASLPLTYCSGSASASHGLADAHEFALAAASDAMATKGDLNSAKQCLHSPPGIQCLNGLLWSRDVKRPWPCSLPIHVSGHTPLDEPEWLDNGKRLRIDTSCVYGNTLTAWSPQLEDFVSVPGPGHNLANFRFL